MEVVKHETCLEYFRRRLREGWKCISLEGHNAVLQSPEGLIRPVDLRNDVETLRPNAAGDETNAKYYDGGYHNPDPNENYKQVDEVDADDDSTFVYGPDATVRDLYNLPAHSEGTDTINFIEVYFRHKTSGTLGSTVSPSLKSNSTVTDGTAIASTNSWVTSSQQWNVNPADSEAWEWADIDALQIGVLLTNDGVFDSYCTQVYVEVDYTPGATEKSSSDTGSGVDAYVSLETAEAKSSSDTGSGVEGTPMPAATLADSESGQGQGAISSQLAAIIAVEVGTSVELGGLLQDLIASELGQGSDSFVAKIEVPTKGGGMKLWI